ncbi:hypothetical protein BG006_003166, partial [Podila minutissima]
SQVGSLNIPSDSIVHSTSLHGRSHDGNVESPFKNLAQTLLAQNSGPSSFNAPLQEQTHKKSESRLDVTKTLQSTVIPKLKAVKEVQWTTYAAPAVLKSDSPLVPPLKKLPVSDILFEHGQAKAGGFATASTERKYVKSCSEVATSDDDDFMPSQVTAKNVPIVKKVSAKKQRC